MAQSGFTMCLGLWITAIILSINIDVSNGEQALDCCLKVSYRPIPRRIVVCYRKQIKGEGCPISAIIFRTRKGRELCAPPDEDWVKDLMDAIDSRIRIRDLCNLGVSAKTHRHTHSPRAW